MNLNNSINLFDKIHQFWREKNIIVILAPIWNSTLGKPESFKAVHIQDKKAQCLFWLRIRQQFKLTAMVASIWIL